MNRINQLLMENGINPSNVTFVDSGETKITSTNVIATDYTFSCSNLLIWSKTFVYLNHMLPTEATDNDKLNKMLEEIELVLTKAGDIDDSLNVLVCSGVSNDNNSKFKFHDYTNLNTCLSKLEQFCKNKNIDYIRHNDVVSKYLIYDPNHEIIILENEVINKENSKKINHF